MTCCPKAAFASAHSCGLRHQPSYAQCKSIPLPQRIRAGCDITFRPFRRDAGLCLSAFVRVATLIVSALSSLGLSFASAHSCGLRQLSLTSVGGLNLFASAHSCGLRRGVNVMLIEQLVLCLSAFVRVATSLRITYPRYSVFASAHSCGLRPCRRATIRSCQTFASAHSCGLRCTSLKDGHEIHFLCHSAFARVATGRVVARSLKMYLCHSAFARVATMRTPKGFWRL